MGLYVRNGAPLLLIQGAGFSFNNWTSVQQNTWYYVLFTRQQGKTNCYVATAGATAPTFAWTDGGFLKSASGNEGNVNDLRLGAWSSGTNGLIGNIAEFCLVSGGVVDTTVVPPSPFSAPVPREVCCQPPAWVRRRSTCCMRAGCLRCALRRRSGVASSFSDGPRTSVLSVAS